MMQKWRKFGLGLLLAMLCAQAHAFDVTIVSGASANGSWVGNSWAPSSAGSRVSATEVVNRLAGATVTVTATGSDNLTVTAPLAWSANTLTLSAGGNVNIHAQLDATASAGLALEFGQNAVTTGNTAVDQVSAPVNLASTGSFSTKLGSDGTPVAYTILTSLGSAGSTSGTDLQGIQGNLAGNYALGTDIDASATSGWNGGTGFMPIAQVDFLPGGYVGFSGRIDGLGHVIDRLTINRPSSNNIGLIGYATEGLIANLGLPRASITGRSVVGGLVGSASTTAGAGELLLTNSYITGSVSGVYSSVGGLLGQDRVVNSNTRLTRVYSAANVASTGGTGGDIGGLVGNGAVSIDSSYATGAVSGSTYVGGLVGFLGHHTVSNSYFSGTVSGTSAVGALFGYAVASVVSNLYWNTDTAGATGFGQTSGGAPTNVAGLTTAQMRDAANYAGFTFTTTPGDAGWVLVGDDGTFNGSNGTVLPLLASEWSSAVGNAHQLQLMALSLSASYTLARTIDAAATNGGAHDVWLSSSFMPIGRSAAGKFYLGHFDGQNRVIDGLTIDRGAINNVGLFGFAQTGSQLSNVGLTNSQITGASYVGTLVGSIVNGSVSNSYADGGSVTATSDYAGGLVGGISNGASSVGNSYAKVSVSGANLVGGLVGINWGALSNSYASGAVSGSSNLGGLVGSNAGAGAVTNGYYADTTGQSDTGRGTRKTAAEMKQLATFAGWDIDDAAGTGKVWRLYQDNSPPLLRGFLTALTVTASNASKTYDGNPYSGGNGVTYSSTPTASLLGTLSYGGAAQGATAIGSYAIIPSGLYSNQRGYDLTFANGTLTIAAVPAADPAPAVIVAAPGATTTLSGTTPVTASPGSTLVIPAGANVAGIAITLAAPASGGEAGPITFRIGGLTLVVSGYSPGTVVSFKKVTINGVDTLVLVVTSGNLSLSGAAGQTLLTLNGNATLTAGADGTAMSFSAGSDGSGAIAVSSGYIVLSANAFAEVRDGKVYAGEVANFDSAGKITGVRLGSLDGKGGLLGDPLGATQAGGPVPVNLRGKAARDPSGLEFGDALSALLGKGFTSLGQNADGVLRLAYAGGTVNALPLGTLAVDTSRPDGVVLRADGVVEACLAGIVTAFVPAVASRGDFLAALPAGSTLSMNGEGVFAVASPGGVRYWVRPAWVATSGGPVGIARTQGGMDFGDGKDSYTLMPAFADYAALRRVVEAEIRNAAFQANPDGSVTVTADGKTYVLLPGLDQQALASDVFNRVMSGQRWWQDADGRLFLNAGGAVQEFSVR